MTEKRNTFVFHEDWWRAAKKLPVNQQTAMIMAIVEYAFDGIEPSDGLLAVAVAQPIIQIDRDRQKFNAKCLQMQANAFKRYQKQANDTENGSEKGEGDGDGDGGKKGKTKNKLFVVPTADEIQAFCDERKNGLSGQTIYDYYQAKGWMIGKNKMKDWKAAVRTWESMRKKDEHPARPSAFHEWNERTKTWELPR